MSARRRLLVLTSPVAVVLVVVLAKSASVVIAGGSAPADFAAGDAAALRGDVAVLNVLNVAEPAKASFAAGGLAVLDGRLDEAVARFTESLDRTSPGESCPVRVNLALVEETVGDRAFGTLAGPTAVTWFERAATIVGDAPSGCFEGNDDPDEQRRAVRDDAADRLAAKLDAARTAPPPPPPPVASAPPPAAPPTGTAPAVEDPSSRLEPETGDPLERLQQILRDGAAAQR